jgi:hypothetical protein
LVDSFFAKAILLFREGSEYEDLGLIAAIHEAMSTISGLQVTNSFDILKFPLGMHRISGRPDNQAFFDIRYPAGYQIALPDIR